MPKASARVEKLERIDPSQKAAQPLKLTLALITRDEVVYRSSASLPHSEAGALALVSDFCQEIFGVLEKSNSGRGQFFVFSAAALDSRSDLRFQRNDAKRSAQPETL